MRQPGGVPWTRIVALVVALVGVGGCSDADDIEGFVSRAWSPDQIAALPDSVTIGDQVLYVVGQANRDFMPISPPDGNPLTTGANLMSSAGGRPDWTPNHPVIYVIREDRMWIVDAQSWQPPAPPGLLWSYYASDGPKWAPGALVDIVLEFDVAPGDRRRIVDRRVVITRSS